MASVLDSAFARLCGTIGVDQATASRAWDLWLRVRGSLCQDDLRRPEKWHACVLYVTACNMLPAEPAATSRRAPAAADNAGSSGLSLRDLLTACQLAPLPFFAFLEGFARRVLDPLAISAAPASLPRVALVEDQARERVRALEVALLLRHHFREAFDVVFPLHDHTGAETRQERWKMGALCWALFLIAKARTAPDMATDLLKAHNLMLCCIHFCYLNARQRPEFRNARFEEIGPLRALCSHCSPAGSAPLTALHDISVVRDKYWRPFLSSIVFEQRLLVDPAFLGAFFADTRPRITDAPVFSPLEHNLRSIYAAYDALLRSECLYDERHLDEVATSAASSAAGNGAAGAAEAGSFTASPMVLSSSPARSGAGGSASSSSSATGSAHIAAIKSIVSGCSVSTLETLLQGIAPSPVEAQAVVTETLAALSAARRKLDAAGCASSDNHEVFRVAVKLFFVLLESVVKFEDEHANCDKARLFALVSRSSFRGALLACSLEVVLHSDGETRFPWILGALGVSAYEFQKLVELVIRADSSLSASTVKHLGRCEMLAIECLVWKSGSALFADLMADNRRSAIFSRKLYTFAARRLKSLARRFPGLEPLLPEVSSLLHRILRADRAATLLVDRHVDTIILCSTHAVAKSLHPSDPSFSLPHLVEAYKTMALASKEAVMRIPLETDSSAPTGTILEFFSSVFAAVMARERAQADPVAAQESVQLPVHKVLREVSPRAVSRRTPIKISALPGGSECMTPEQRLQARRASWGLPQLPAASAVARDKRSGRRTAQRLVFKRPGETIEVGICGSSLGVCECLCVVDARPSFCRMCLAVRLASVCARPPGICREFSASTNRMRSRILLSTTMPRTTRTSSRRTASLVLVRRCPLLPRLRLRLLPLSLSPYRLVSQPCSRLL
eukprot:m.17196 g.17196  ORF g.17196 m.17196 type:complete len:907 (+) comp3571_c0_seq1:183-2903(+)